MSNGTAKEEMGIMPGIDDFPALRKRRAVLVDLVTVRQRLVEQVKKLEERKESINKKLEKMLTEAGAKRVAAGKWHVTVVEGMSASRVSKEKLLELGVSPGTIVGATIPGTPYNTIQVVEPKKNKGNKGRDNG